LGRHDRVPSCKAIKTWVENFGETALKKKPLEAQQTQQTPQNIEAVRTSFKKSSRRFVRKQVVALDLRRTTVRRILYTMVLTSNLTKFKLCMS
jgi:hypothetical protein